MKIDKTVFVKTWEVEEKTYGLLLVSKAMISPYNVRPEVTIEDTRELAESIKEEGLLQTPLCTPEGKIFVGGRRLKAVEHNKGKAIHVEIRDYTPAQQWRASLGENTKRKELTINEEGKALKNIRDIEGISIREMERRGIGSLSDISQKIRVYEEFSEAQAFRGETPVEVVYGTGKPSDSKEVTYEKAKALAPLKKTDKEILVEKIQDEGMTKSQVESQIKKAKEIRELVSSVQDEEQKKFLKKEIEPKIFEKEMTKEVAKTMVLRVEGFLIKTPEVIVAFNKLFPQIENFCKMFPAYGTCTEEDKEKELLLNFKIKLPKKLLKVKADVSKETEN